MAYFCRKSRVAAGYLRVAAVYVAGSPPGRAGRKDNTEAEVIVEDRDDAFQNVPDALKTP
jgi:hypothetical protein